MRRSKMGRQLPYTERLDGWPATVGKDLLQAFS